MALRRVFLALILAGIFSASYFSAFHGTRLVLGHAVPCGGSNPPCLKKYYAAQDGNKAYLSGYSHGIEGSINFQDVALYGNYDFNAHWLNAGTTNGDRAAGAQMGFIEGSTDQGWKPTPTLYYERIGGACQSPGRAWDVIDVQYNPDYPMIYWNGRTQTCNGRAVYEYEIGRMGGGSFAIVYMYSALSFFSAGSEHSVFTSPSYLEHNGIQCFGTFGSCSGQFGLWLYNKGGGYWEYWGMERATKIRDADTNDPPGCCPGYYHEPLVEWSSFYTRSTW